MNAEAATTGSDRSLDAVMLDAVLACAPGQVVVIDGKGVVLYANRRFEVAFAAGASLIGRDVRSVIGKSVTDMLRADIRRAYTGETVRNVGWLTYPEHGRRYVDHTIAPYRVGERTVGVIAFARDLTELQHSEQALAEEIRERLASEAINKAITRAALDCIVVADANGCIIAFNPAAERVFGHAEAAVLGKPIGEVIVPHHMRERHAQGMARYMAGGAARVIGRRVEMEALKADGTVFPVELAITETTARGERVLVAYLRDLTEARAQAEEIERQRGALVQSDKLAAMGSLLAGVAHELNNPLSIVVGQSQMLHETLVGSAAGFDRYAAAARAGKVQQAAERCARIIRSFLAMARQRPVERRAVDLLALIRQSAELLDYGMRSTGIELRLDLPLTLPATEGDPDQIQQILMNLLVNAKQALEAWSGPRVITLAAAARDGAITVRVVDTGPGIARAIRARVFDPFFTTKETGSGTGIGLSVSRGFAEAHGGSLSLIEAGAGAAFELVLPIRAPSPIADLAVRGDEPGRAPGQARLALVIDDEPEIASLLAETLERAGYVCLIAEGGVAAQALLAQGHEPQIVFCDLRMPKMDGPAFHRWASAEHPDIAKRMVFVTGDTLGPSAGRFLAECGRPVIEKPFAAEEVLRVAERVAREAAG